MIPRDQSAKFEREAAFWCLVVVSTGLYVVGGRTRPVGGWILLRALHVLNFWIEVAGAIGF